MDALSLGLRAKNWALVSIFPVLSACVADSTRATVGSLFFSWRKNLRERLKLDFLYSSLWTQVASQMRVSLLKIEKSILFLTEVEKGTFKTLSEVAKRPVGATGVQHCIR